MPHESPSELTQALARAAAAQRAGFVVEAKPRGDAAALFATIQSQFGGAGKARLARALEHSNSRPNPSRSEGAAEQHGATEAVGRGRRVNQRELLARVLETYAATTPSNLAQEVETAAFLLIPAVSAGGLRETIIDFWVAHSGLSFALEAFAESFRINVKLWGLDGINLESDAERTIESIWGGRLDRAFRAHLLAATPEERALARTKALELRLHGDLLVRSAMSSLFLEAEWIDADLDERVRTGARAVFTEVALQHAADASALASYFSAMTEAEARFVASIRERNFGKTVPHFALVLADRFREEAVVPIAKWIARSMDIANDAEHFDAAVFIAVILDGIAAVQPMAGSAEVAQTGVRLLAKLQRAKVDERRLLANQYLRTWPELALPYVRETAREKNGAWARELAGQLERLSTTASVVEAPVETLPRVLLEKRRFKPPSFWSAEGLTRPLTLAKTAFPLAAVDALGAILAAGDAEAASSVKEACDPSSLALFAWDLFQSWLSAGAPAKDKWAFLALGRLGNDESARKLTPLLRAWPGEAAHQRAVLGLEVLAEIGSDVALMMLNGIAQKVKFKGLQERARQKMDEIARRRHLTSDELADRLVPDLDLDDDGSKTLDFGPRSFRVGFDETLSPFVMDAAGARLKELPKPNKKDDPELAAEAVLAWKAMKKDARTLSALEILRLELAMSSERRWSPQEFDDFLVSHPLLIHLVRRLVWGTFTSEGKLVGTFRVAEDRSYADVQDDAFAVPTDALVGLPHRFRLSDDDVAKWSGVFRDYEIVQPFEQLTRSVFVLSEEEKASTSLRRFEGRVVETRKVIGLQSRGWRRGAAQDGSVVSFMYKPIARDLSAWLPIEEGLVAASMDLSDPTQRLGVIQFRPDEPALGTPPSGLAPGQISDVVLSEVLRDVESLGETEET